MTELQLRIDDGILGRAAGLNPRLIGFVCDGDAYAKDHRDRGCIAVERVETQPHE